MRLLELEFKWLQNSHISFTIPVLVNMMLHLTYDILLSCLPCLSVCQYVLLRLVCLLSCCLCTMSFHLYLFACILAHSLAVCLRLKDFTSLLQKCVDVVSTFVERSVLSRLHLLLIISSLMVVNLIYIQQCRHLNKLTDLYNHIYK